MVELALPVTSASAGILGLAFALASFGVFLSRFQFDTLYGYDFKSPLYWRSRGAGTIGDYSTIGLILLGLSEYNGTISPSGLKWWAILFVATRLAHAVSLAFPKVIPVPVRGGSFVTTILLLSYSGLLLAFTSSSSAKAQTIV